MSLSQTLGAPPRRPLQGYAQGKEHRMRRADLWTFHPSRRLCHRSIRLRSLVLRRKTSYGSRGSLPSASGTPTRLDPATNNISRTRLKLFRGPQSDRCSHPPHRIALPQSPRSLPSQRDFCHPGQSRAPRLLPSSAPSRLRPAWRLVASRPVACPPNPNSVGRFSSPENSPTRRSRPHVFCISLALSHHFYDGEKSRPLDSGASLIRTRQRPVRFGYRSSSALPYAHLQRSFAQSRARSSRPGHL